MKNTTSFNQWMKQCNEDDKVEIKKEIDYYDLLNSFKQARKQKGMSQAELAEKANINRTTLSKVETGIRNATIGTLEKIATALDLKLELGLK